MIFQSRRFVVGGLALLVVCWSGTAVSSHATTGTDDDANHGDSPNGRRRHRRFMGHDLIAAKQAVNDFESMLSKAFDLIVGEDRGYNEDFPMTDDDDDDEEDYYTPTKKQQLRVSPETRRLKGSSSSSSSSSSSKSSKGSNKSKRGYDTERSQDTPGSGYDMDLDQCIADLDRHDVLLSQCQADLASLTGGGTVSGNSNTSVPSYLFVQMAQDCVLSKESDGTHTISSSDFDDDTYIFTDRPLRHEDTETTISFFEQFGELFGENSPNAAVTMVAEDATQFEGPIIALFLDSVVISNTSLSYVISQSDEQASTTPIDSFFGPGETSTTFRDCSFFIDNANGKGGSNCATAKQRLENCLTTPSKQSSGCPHWVQNCYKYCTGPNEQKQCQNIINKYTPGPEPQPEPNPEPEPVGGSYCTWAPDYTCYYTGRPLCCTQNPWNCPSTEPPCDLQPPPGASYCTWAPDNNCYQSGWPACCGFAVCPSDAPTTIMVNDVQWCCPEYAQVDSNTDPPCPGGFQPSPAAPTACPEIQPDCDKTISGSTYCTWSPDKTCYQTGWPSCCQANGPSTNPETSCPQVQPPCDVNTDYCNGQQDFSCYPNTNGYPSCCESTSSDCPRSKPGCNS